MQKSSFFCLFVILLAEMQFWVINSELISLAMVILIHVLQADFISLWNAKG